MTTPSRLSFSSIRRYAERVGEHHEIYDEATGYADLDDLIDQLGGEVRVGVGDESLHVFERGNFLVYVPPTTSPRRDRFTIARELGHYFLHYLYPERTGVSSFARGGRDRAETEANVFAASLLMPETPFRRAHEECGGNSHRLAVTFGVSPAAADVRCQVLGLPR